jgi:hypothetical protein
MKRTAIILASMSALVLAAGCTTDPVSTDKSGTFYGTPVTVGSGSARTMVTLDKDGNPTSVGVAINEAAMGSLPASDAEYTLTFPAQIAATGYDHMGLDWNSHGHEPDHIYTFPHFDFHFYQITSAERDGITPADTVKAMNAPDTNHVPAGYISTVNVVPRMGVHWADPTSSEFQPNGSFTRTMIYGYYDGKMIFTEPMITREYMLTRPNSTVDMKVPAMYPKTGVYYATKYTVRYDDAAKEYIVSLDGLVKR